MSESCTPREEEAEEEPEEEVKLNLGDRRLEKFVEDLKAGPAKLQAFIDEVENFAKKLHDGVKAINDLEVGLGDMESDLMSTEYEQQSVDEQIAELPPEQARVHKSKESCKLQLEQLRQDFLDDNDSKLQTRREIASLEEQIGLGAGWTDDQLIRKRKLEREIGELVVDKERRQQELDQVVRENAAGREATGRSGAALEATEEELAAHQAMAEALGREAEAHLEAKRVCQDAMHDKYADQERLEGLHPELATLVERGTKEIVALQHEVRDLQKKGDLASKQLEASATALETKRREINDAEVRVNHRRGENGELQKQITSAVGEAALSAKELREAVGQVAKGEGLLFKAEEERQGAEVEKAAVRAQIANLEVEVAAAKRLTLNLAREKDSLSAQGQVLAKQEKDKAGLAGTAKKLTDLLEAQQRALVLEVLGLTKGVEAMRDQVEDLEEQIELNGSECLATEHRVEVVQRQLVAAESSQAELLALEEQTAAELKAAQGEHKAVVDERRRARAQLNDLTDLVREQRDLFAAAGAELEEYKQALTRNTKQRLRVHFDQYLMDKEIAAASAKVSRIAKFQASSVALLEQQGKEVDRLQALAEAATRQIKDAERDIQLTLAEGEKLSNQGQSTRDETAKVLERITTKARILDMGKGAYDNVLADRAAVWRKMAQLKREIKDLTPPVAQGGDTWVGELALSPGHGDGDGSGGGAGFGHPHGSEHSRGGSLAESQKPVVDVKISDLPPEEIKRRVIRLERELQEELVRTVSLEEEAQRPINVHRWFKLETTDPDKMAAIKRLRSLTKQLVETSNRIAAAEKKTQAKKALCAKVQQALVKAGHAVVEGGGVGASDKETGSKAGTGGTVKPGKGLEQGTVVTLVSAESAMTPMVERVQGLGAMLKERQGRLDSLRHELEMYTQQVQLEGETLHKLDDQMDDLKQAWFAECRRQRAAQERAHEEAHDLDHLSKFDTSKFGAETGHKAGTVLGLQQSSGFEASGLLSP